MDRRKCRKSGKSLNREEGEKRVGFFPKQRAAIHRALEQASRLLGREADDLALPDDAAVEMGLMPGTTYHKAIDHAEGSPDRRVAWLVTRAVLRLSEDDRVRGTELVL